MVDQVISTAEHELEAEALREAKGEKENPIFARLRNFFSESSEVIAEGDGVVSSIWRSLKSNKLMMLGVGVSLAILPLHAPLSGGAALTTGVMTVYHTLQDVFHTQEKNKVIRELSQASAEHPPISPELAAWAKIEVPSVSSESDECESNISKHKRAPST